MQGALQKPTAVRFRVDTRGEDSSERRARRDGRPSPTEMPSTRSHRHNFHAHPKRYARQRTEPSAVAAYARIVTQSGRRSIRTNGFRQTSKRNSNEVSDPSFSGTHGARLERLRQTQRRHHSHRSCWAAGALSLPWQAKRFAGRRCRQRTSHHRSIIYRCTRRRP